jgi:two-component system CheB/CheR fusion protein
MRVLDASSTPSRDRSAEPVEPLVLALRAVAAARDLASVMAAVRHHARRLVSADGATFVLREGTMVHYADEDAIEPLWKGRRFPAQACISGIAMLHRESIVIEDIRADRRVPQDAYRNTFVKSMVMVPIGRGAPLGAIGAYWARRHRASDREVATLEAVAEAAAAAVANADLLARLERAVALRDGFLALAAHELNTPLTAVRLRADAVGRACKGVSGAPDLGPLHAALARLGDTVSGLLEFSRVSEEGISLVRGPVDLADVARTVMEGLRGRATATGTELRLSAPGPVRGEWDAGRLARAIGHLVENAAKFGRGKPVDVTVSEEAGEARVAVRDRGPGVPGEARERIFAKFERAAPAENVGGLGLGLWMARAVAEAHGGTVTVDGAPGGGALFTLRVPKRLPVG